VADMRSLQVETVDVDEYVVGQVRIGLPVHVRVDALDNATLAGTVSGVALLPQATAAVRKRTP
jgi:multidrug resistance efflux pump